jgi:hypothetical protein
VFAREGHKERASTNSDGNGWSGQRRETKSREGKVMNSVQRLRNEHPNKRQAGVDSIARSTALARNTLTPRPVKEAPSHAAMLLV